MQAILDAAGRRCPSAVRPAARQPRACPDGPRRCFTGCSTGSTRGWRRGRWKRACPMARAGCWAGERPGRTASFICTAGGRWSGWRAADRPAGIAPGRRANGRAPIRCRCSRCSCIMPWRWGRWRGRADRRAGPGGRCTGCGATAAPDRGTISPSTMTWAMTSTGPGSTMTCIIPAPCSPMLTAGWKAWRMPSGARRMRSLAGWT